MTLPLLKISDEKALKLLHYALLVTAVSVFLPYVVVSVILPVTAACILLISCLRNKILVHRGSVTVFVFLAVTSVVALCNGNFVGLRRTLVFASMMIVTFVARSCMTRDFFEKMLNFVILGGCCSTVVSIVEAVICRDDPLYRSKAFFTNPNFFGTALTFVILICAYKAATGAKHPAVYYAAAIFNTLGLYLCGSMSLWLVAFLGILLTLILTKQYRLLAVFLGIAAVALTAILLIPGMIPRLNEVSDTVINREKIWLFAIENIKDSPVFGRGFYSYKFLYDKLHETQVIYPAAMAHSVILDSFLCHGAVGVALIITAVTQFFRSVFVCRKKLKTNGMERPISGFIIAISIAVACYGLMDTTFVWVQTGMILMLISTGLGVEEREAENIAASKSDAVD